MLNHVVAIFTGKVEFSPVDLAAATSLSLVLISVGETMFVSLGVIYDTITPSEKVTTPSSHCN